MRAGFESRFERIRCVCMRMAEEVGWREWETRAYQRAHLVWHVAFADLC